jgi:hypothetical protein
MTWRFVPSRAPWRLVSSTWWSVPTASIPRCVNWPSVDNLLGPRDQAMRYNEPGRGAAMFTVRGNQRAMWCCCLGVDRRASRAVTLPPEN